MSGKRALDASVVLVVEEDDLVRLFDVEMLGDAGLDVVEARQTDEAWFILHDRSDIGVLFTDVDMPGTMCGVTLAESVHDAWPDARLVLIAGRNRFNDRDLPDHGLFVAKPYSDLWRSNHLAQIAAHSGVPGEVARAAHPWARFAPRETTPIHAGDAA